MRRTVLVHEWVTGGGLAGSHLPPSWATEGGAMRRAIGRDFAAVPGVRVVVTLDDRLPDEPGPWTIVRLGPGQESVRFGELAAEADLTALIAPESGGILAERTRILERAGAAMLGSSSEAVDVAGDKLRLGALLAARGIATPEGRRVVPAEGLPYDFPYPAVLKPIDGAGSVDTFLIRDPAQVPAEAGAMAEALLQPFVPGTPMSASFLAGAGRPRLVAIGWQVMNIREGRFVYQGGMLPAPRTCFDPALGLAVEAIPGLRGFVGVDFVRDEATGRAVVLEINPRPTTSLVGLVRLLPPGWLARAWMDVVGGTLDAENGGWDAGAEAEAVLTFEADGTIRHREG